MAPGRVIRLSIAPVKGLQVQHPEAIELTTAGAVGDRDFFMVDEQDKLVSVVHTGALLPLRPVWDAAARRLALHDDAAGETWEDELRLGAPITADFHAGHRFVPGRVVEGPWSALLSERAGRPLRLVYADARGNGVDVHPVTLLGAQSVAELARHAGLPKIDSRRFRMLIDFDGFEPWAEDGWVGRRVRVGEAELLGGGPVPRCAATTRNPERGMRDAPIVRLIKQCRGMHETELGMGVVLGVFARVLREGTVRVGGPVEPVELEASDE